MLASVLLVLWTPACWAQEREPIIIHPYLALDGFLPGQAGKGLQEDGQLAVSYLAAVGWDVKGQIVTKPAPALRGGINAELHERFDLGFAIGYVHGPDSKLEINVSAPGQTGTLTDDRTVRFLRYLLEPTVHLSRGDPWGFHLAAAIGYAQGTVQERISCFGNACVRSGESRTLKSNWGGLSWEVSPYASYGSMVFGLRYAAFPEFNGGSGNSKIKWNAPAVFLGARY